MARRIALPSFAVSVAGSLAATRAATLALLALVPACVGPNTGPDDSRPARTRQSAADVAPSQAYTISFDGQVVGYLIEVLPMAAGSPDPRAYEPGTALIEDLDHTLLGYISPHATTYRFDESGAARTVGFGSRNSSITAFFRKNDPPTLTETKL